MDKTIKNRIKSIRAGKCPKGYKKTEIGFLPSDWSVAKLSNITEEITQEAGTQVYETVSISAGIGFVNQAEKFGKELSGKQYEKYKVLHKGDFSYNKGNSNKYPQGCIYRLKDRDTAAVPNVFESFRVISGCPEYYDQLFISGFLNKQLARLINHGVRDDGLLNLTSADFYSCLLPVPPLKVQEKIAEILDCYDRIIELLEEKTEEYKKLKRICLNKMFPQKGCSVPEWRFQGFCDNWELKKFLDFTFPAGEKNKNDLSLEPYAITNEFGFTPQSTAHNEFGYMENVDRKMYIIVKSNSFAYNPARINVGSLGYYDGSNDVIISSLYEVFNTSDDVDDIFLNQWFKTKEFVDWILKLQEGSVRQYFYYDKLCECQMCIPSIKEQHQIGAFLKKIDILITIKQREVIEYRRLKKALLQLLLTGIIKVSK